MSEENEIKKLYIKYIQTLIIGFKIVEQKLFRDQIAKHIAIIPLETKDIDKLNEWNNEFFDIVIRNSTLTKEQIVEKITNGITELTDINENNKEK